VYVVSAAPGEERTAANAAAEQVRARFAEALLVDVHLPGLVLQQGASIDTIPIADKSATSLAEALQICLDWLEERTKA
jgi:hypothetical protein